MAVVTAFCVQQSDREKHCMLAPIDLAAIDLAPIDLAPIDLVSQATCKTNSGSTTLTGA